MRIVRWIVAVSLARHVPSVHRLAARISDKIIPVTMRLQPAKFIGLLAILLASLGLTGCGGSLVEAGQPSASRGSLRLSSGSGLGQSFMGYYGGLHAIEFQLAPQDPIPTTGALTFQLRRSADSTIVLASGAFDTSRLAASRLRIDFPSQSADRLQDYYISLEYSGIEGIEFTTGPASSYLNGAAYVNGRPQEAQLTFRLYHDPLLTAIGIALLFGQWILYGVVAFCLLVVPGLALFLCLPAPMRRSAGRIGAVFLSPALSLGIYPLLIVFSGLAGLKLGSLNAWLPIFAGLAVIAIYAWKRRPNVSSLVRVRPDPAHMALLGVVGLLVFSRLWAIRALDVPMWGDSYQHSVLTQLLLDRDGLFDDWKPYADMLSLTYHIGFHSISAAFGWLTGLHGPLAVMWTGQFLNIASVLVLYPLAQSMTKSRWAGIFAVVTAGAISIHPGYYVNWGRYTQLAGQVVLPALIWLIWATIRHARGQGQRFDPVGLIAVTGLTWAGLGLNHYRLLIAGVVFAFSTVGGALGLRKMGRKGLLLVAAGCALGFILFLPWYRRVLTGEIASAAGQLLSTPLAQTPDSIVSYNAVPSLTDYYPLAIWILVVAACGIGLARRSFGIASLVIWIGAMIAATNPNWVGLPGAGIISNFALILGAYIPFAVVLAVSSADLLASIAMSFPATARIGRPLIAVVVAILSIVGTRARIQDVDPNRFELFLRPDTRAANWIRKNTPETAMFLVDSFPAYGGTLIAGSDGGWWLPLMARRATTQPPLNYSNERLPVNAGLELINALPEAIRADGLTATNFEQLTKRGITHIYIGQARGMVGGPGVPMLNPELLFGDTRVRAVYQQDRVLIFEILP